MINASTRKTFIVHTVKVSEAVANLPPVEPCTTFVSAIDLLILAAGFEERVLAVPRMLRRDNVTVTGCALVGEYDTNRTDNKLRYSELSPLIDALTERTEFVNADSPEAISRKVFEIMSQYDCKRLRVAFDISGASSTFILAVLSTIFRANADIELHVLYTTAASYDDSRSVSESQLELQEPREIGVGSAPILMPQVGHHHDHLPASIIAVPSLYTGRLEACLAHLNVGPMKAAADDVFWVLPATDAQEHRWRQNRTREAVEDLMLRLQGRSRLADSSYVFADREFAECPVLEYARMVEILICRIDETAGRNFSIIHMGTKIQAVGVALAASARSEVVVLTARPKSFVPSRYSAGIGKTYRVTFQNVSATVHDVARIGSVSVSCP